MGLTQHFPDPVHVSPLLGDDWKKRRLLHTFRYYPDMDQPPIIIPKGFLTDYASVPRFLWPVIPPWGQHGPAAIVHDFLYDRQRGKRYADRIFLKALKHLGVGFFKRWAMYAAVAAFGVFAYHKHKK